MIDVARDRWPADMRRASEASGGEGWEGMAEGLVHSLRRYIREEPETAALWALGLGFVLGWKLKIW
jgi:hypothetical protein